MIFSGSEVFLHAFTLTANGESVNLWEVLDGEVYFHLIILNDIKG